MEEMNEFMEEFMFEMSRTFPNLLVQFEDFATDKVRHNSAISFVTRRHRTHVFSIVFRLSLTSLLSGIVIQCSTMIFRALVVSFFQVS